jgi:hypothetical protein
MIREVELVRCFVCNGWHEPRKIGGREFIACPAIRHEALGIYDYSKAERIKATVNVEEKE